MGVDYKQIGIRIKCRRKQMGKTQERLAESLGVTVGYISQLERGVTKISLDTLAQISILLDCDMTYLLSGAATERADYLTDELLSGYRLLSQEQKRMLVDLIEVMVARRRL